jgi:hypothetical protein
MYATQAMSVSCWLIFGGKSGSLSSLSYLWSRNEDGAWAAAMDWEAEERVAQIDPLFFSFSTLLGDSYIPQDLRTARR